MPTFDVYEFDHDRLHRIRERIRREMLAAKFQIGSKFDSVLVARTHKAYNRGELR